MTPRLPDCPRFEDDLKAYADGELPLLRRAAVRRHLTRCLFCRKEIAAMTQITEDLRAAEPEALPPTLREKLLQEPGPASVPGTAESSVAERLSFNSSPAGPVPGQKRRVPVWLYAAAAVIAWFVFYPLFQKTRPQAADTRYLAVLSNPTAPMASDRQMALPPPVTHRPLAAPQAFSVNRAAPALPASAVPPPAAAPPVPTDNVSALPDTDLDTQRQVHKEAAIGIQVPNPDATGDTLSQMVQETGGYVAANSLSTNPDGLKSGEMIVKVPVAQFDTFLKQVAKLGIVQSKNISGEDITDKTSDANAAQAVQESDLQKSEARLKALGSHAKWEDQENTRDLRVQLAQTRARLVLLKRLAALGSLTIDLSQTPKAVPPPPVTNGFTGSLKATTHNALLSLVGSAGALLALVIWLLAYAPIWIPLLLVGRYALKEYKKREATPSR